MKYSFAILALTAASVNAIQLKMKMDLERMTNQADNVLMQFKSRAHNDDEDIIPTHNPEHYQTKIQN